MKMVVVAKKEDDPEGASNGDEYAVAVNDDYDEEEVLKTVGGFLQGDLCITGEMTLVDESVQEFSVWKTRQEFVETAA